MTTIVVCADGMVYDLGKGEFPPQPPNKKIKEDRHLVVNATVVTVKEAERLQRKIRKQPKV